jgi:hypothetical protein
MDILQAGSLLYFMCEEAPRMDSLAPAVRLASSTRERLKTYTSLVFTRYATVAAGAQLTASQQARALQANALPPQTLQAEC